MTAEDSKNKAASADSKDQAQDGQGSNDTASPADGRPKEVGGRGGLDPTRYGDWEKNGRCIDF